MQIKNNYININSYLLSLLSLIIISGTIIYYLYSLNTLGIIISLFLLILISIRFKKELFNKKIEIKTRKINFNKKNFFYPALYFLSFIISILILKTAQSSQALISPWNIVPNSFWIFYLLSSLLLVFTIFKKNLTPLVKIVLISFHYFLSFSIAIIVYKIGYGFDPFIHQATMELINKKGLVTPKPPYYIGQYSLIVILHNISGFSIYFLNKIIVPLLTALFVPLAIYNFLKNQDQTKNNINKLLSILFILALTFSPFSVTTPQNLSYVFLLLAILNGLNKGKEKIVLLLSLATLAIHPLTGIPAITWSIWLFYKKYKKHFKERAQKILSIIIFLSTALFLPLALLFAGGNSIKKISWNLNFITQPFSNFFQTLSSAGQETWYLNFVYFFHNNFNLIILIIIISSLIYFYKTKNIIQKKLSLLWKGLGMINISLIIAYIVINQISFNNLINYEQFSYANRILVILVLFNIPFILLSLNDLIKRILDQEKIIKIVWLTIGLSLLLSSLYISYPRFDKYFNSRGYSTSLNDIEAVNYIDKNHDNSYIVLANQQVGVAALKELGFDNYYKTKTGEIFFYSIPTGGELYQYYLEMVYKNPNKETMLKAMNVAGVNEAYLVVNKYWNQSGLIIAKAKLSANDWENINNQVYIFKYLR